MKALFYKLSKIIFSLDTKSLIGYCNKFKKFMKLIKIIYCDYIIQNYGLITNINNANYCDKNEFICDINYIPNIIELIKCILNEDYLEKQYNNNIRVKLDDRDEKLSYKMRESQIKKIPLTLILGDKERDANEVSYRVFGSKDTNTLKKEEFISFVLNNIKDKKRDL